MKRKQKHSLLILQINSWPNSQNLRECNCMKAHLKIAKIYYKAENLIQMQKYCCALAFFHRL